MEGQYVMETKEKYELTGVERKEESTQKVECGEVITTSYFLDGVIDPVRVDKTVNVDPIWFGKAIQGLL